LWTFFAGYSQEVFHEKITITDGLPSNNVYDIMQDKKGFVWFATDDGISRFDGRNFVVFKSKNKNGNSGSLIKQDDLGRIWYENFDGYLNYIQNDSVYKLQNQGNPMGFVNYAIANKQLLNATQTGYDVVDLKTLKISKRANLNNFKTCFLETQNQKTYFFDPELKFAVLQNSTISIHENYLTVPLVSPIFCYSDAIYCTDKSNTNKNMYKIENDKVVTLFEFTSNQTIQNFYFLENKFWICTSKGLIILDKNGKRLNEKPFFDNYSLTSLLIDTAHQYWIGTLNNGVIRFSDFNDIQQDISAIKPLLLSKDESQLYVGNENGEIYALSKDFQSLKRLPLKTKNQIIYINNLHPTFNFIVADGCYKTDKKFKVLDHQTYALKSIDFIDQDEAIMAASGFVGFLNIGKNRVKSKIGEFKYKSDRYTVLDNVRGKIALWNKFEKEALFLCNLGLYSYKNNVLKQLKLPNADVGIRSIRKAKETIYALSDDGKLYRYNKGSFITIKTDLEEITFFKSIDDMIYIASKNTIYELKNNAVHKLLVLPILERIQDLQTNKNYFYILNQKRIIRYNRISKEFNRANNPIFLEKIWVNNQDFTSKSKINLKYYQNDVKLQVAMIDFTKIKSVFYRINNGFWKEILNNGNVLQLSSLSPNNYKIEFSTEKDGAVLEKVFFEIEQPFWRKWWFYLLIILLLTTLFSAIYLYRLKQITVKKNLIIDKLQLENNLNESKIKLIKAQMNPHFFFNALNTIQSYIATNETEEATDYLNKFSKLTRMILEMTDKNWITIDEEVKMQTLYLNLQKIRLSHFDFQIKIKNNSINTATIPTMLLQPYIENAVIHGLAHKVGTKNLWVNIDINSQNQLEIIIKDDGIGLAKSNEINSKNTNKNASFATKATLERLEIINRNDFKIEIETNELFDTNEKSEGTEIKITMDFRYEMS
jgi:hypothetical protein